MEQEKPYLTSRDLAPVDDPQASERAARSAQVKNQQTARAEVYAFNPTKQIIALLEKGADESGRPLSLAQRIDLLKHLDDKALPDLKAVEANQRPNLEDPAEWLALLAQELGFKPVHTVSTASAEGQGVAPHANEINDLEGAGGNARPLTLAGGNPPTHPRPISKACIQYKDSGQSPQNTVPKSLAAALDLLTSQPQVVQEDVL